MPFTSLPTSPEALAISPGIALGIGAALLIAGRKLFWLFVGAVGFFTAMRLATEVFGAEHSDWVLIGSVIAGLLGAVLAVFVQKAAVGLAGAVTAAYLLDQFFRRGMETYPHLAILFLVVAAILGAIMMVIVFDWALIFLTSLLGAHLIAQLVTLPRLWLLAVYVALVALGVAIQSQRRRGAS